MESLWQNFKKRSSKAISLTKGEKKKIGSLKYKGKLTSYGKRIDMGRLLGVRTQPIPKLKKRKRLKTRRKLKIVYL